MKRRRKRELRLTTGQAVWLLATLVVVYLVLGTLAAIRNRASRHTASIPDGEDDVVAEECVNELEKIAWPTDVQPEARELEVPALRIFRRLGRADEGPVLAVQNAITIRVWIQPIGLAF